MGNSKENRRRPRHRVSATDAARNFSRLVDKVREERASYVIERGGKPVARIAPAERLHFTMAELKVLVASLPAAGVDYLRLVEHASARHNRPRVRRNPWER